MTSLYDEGWLQGSIVEALLPLDVVVLNSQTGKVERLQSEDGLWVIATQDCELANSEADEETPCIELRPVFLEDPPKDWGIRSSRFLLTEAEYLKSASARLIVSPTVLTALVKQDVIRRKISEARRKAFATWLGLRYDRPAVPDDLVPLLKNISEKVTSRRNRLGGIQVRDILVQVDKTLEPTRFSLFAILVSQEDEDAVRMWLSKIAQEIPLSLGIADQIEAKTAEGISFQLIETSYAADVTQVTWRQNDPEPNGAT
ncbi:MAG: hypothetical protein M0T78_03430 [Actinomycetota bacterium]|nr:hypothetical protein [Actinomycetota bacterium]